MLGITAEPTSHESESDLSKHELPQGLHSKASDGRKVANKMADVVASQCLCLLFMNPMLEESLYRKEHLILRLSILAEQVLHMPL
jgi:hypothetical protein